MWLNISAALH